MYVEEIDHLELNKDKDAIATANPKGLEDMGADSIFLPEEP